MMERFAKIENGFVQNVIESEVCPDSSYGLWKPCPDDTAIGFLFDGVNFIRPAPVINKADRTITKLAYMNRFTDDELELIYSAAKTSVTVEIWLEKFKLATEIWLDDPVTVAGLAAMVYIGLLYHTRPAEILA